MEAIIIAISPAVVSALTSWVKKAKTITTSKHRKAILRIIVAVLSLGAVVGASIISGEAIEVASVEGILSTVFVAGSTLITYYFGKKKDE